MKQRKIEYKAFCKEQKVNYCGGVGMQRGCGN
jgi:hypothetical protein